MMAHWKGPAAWMGREARAGDRLPYAKHHDASTIILRDGAAMQTLRIAGLPFETEESTQLDHMLAVRETMLRSLLDARFVLYHHVVRRQVRAELDAVFPESFSASLDAARRDELSHIPLFVNEQFVTILRRPPRGKTGLAERLFRRSKANMPDLKEIRELQTVTTGLLAALQPYGAQMLAMNEGRSEPLELLSALYNGEWCAVALPDGDTDIGYHLPYARVSFGLEAIETRSPGGRSYSTILGIKEYPDATRAGMIDNLLRLPHEMVLSESFALADRQIARERIDLALRRLKSADEDALTERGQMMAARDALGGGEVAFGDHHLTVMVKARTLAALDRATAAATGALSDIGIIAVREDVNLEPSFWAQFPGNENYAVRRAMVSTSNAAGFLSLHGFPLGKAQNNHWGDAVSMFETTSATPYFFNYHQGDLGNFTIIGPSGSGKTVILNYLTAQAQKFNPRTILFDKDRGAEIFLRTMGAHYSRMIPGEPTGFNPLALSDSPASRAFLRQFIGHLVHAKDAAEEAIIAEAVDALYEHDGIFRRLRFLRELLSGGRRPEPGDLPSRLAPWIMGGPHAWLFDNAEDRLDLNSRIIGCDMTALLDDPLLRTPALMYVFHRIDERLDGEPTMILIDEGWKALDDEVFAARIRDWLKTLRKRNAMVGFATQSARDALDSRIASAIVEQTATMIFTPNSRARAEDYCDGFGLTLHELALIRALPANSRCFLVRHANDSMVLRLDLSGMPEFLTILSGREANVRKLDVIRAQVGDDPAIWLPALTGVDWPEFERGFDENFTMEAAE